MLGGIRIIAALCVICAILAVPGVHAYWRYATLLPYDSGEEMSSQLSVFDYPPEQILPDDDISSSLGENHLLLITQIVEHKTYGLNATKKPIIHNYLKKPGDVIYCSQNVQGGNLKHLMVDGVSEAERLYFVITEISDTEYHAFTMNYSDIEDNPVGTKIVAYLTVIKKDADDGEWKTAYSHRVLVKVNDPGVVSKAIDVTSWEMFENNLL